MKDSRWSLPAVLLGRLIFAAAFGMAAGFKLADVGATASFIASAGFPLAHLLTWLAIVLEIALVLGFLTGACFPAVCLVAAAYVLFLTFAFHGPSHWAANQAEFGFFVDHFIFIAGLLFGAAHGPGNALVWTPGRRAG